MAARLEITTEAEDDLDDAYAWYESQRPGLGEDFASAFLACMNSVFRAPRMHERVYKEYRRALVRRFPYAAYYESNADVVVVYAVSHTARHPESWKRRLP